MTNILPAVPAGRLAPTGHAIPAQDIKGLVATVAEADPVEAVAIQLSVVIDVLEAIRDGHPDWVGLASAALVVLDVDHIESIRALIAKHPDGRSGFGKPSTRKGSPMSDYTNFDLVEVGTPNGLKQFPCEHTESPHLRISASGMDNEGRAAFGGWSIVVVPSKSVLPVPVPHRDSVETLRWMTSELANAGINWEAPRGALAAAVAPVLRDLIRQADEADQAGTPPGELSVSTLRRITEGNKRALARQEASRG